MNLLEELKESFGAIPEGKLLNEQEEHFLEERNKLEISEEVYYLDGYTRQYEQLKKFGLEDRLMEQLDFLIEWYLENRIEALRESEFYRKFQNHPVVKKAEANHLELKQQLK